MPTSPGEWLREVDFWRTLEPEAKELYVECTSTMPMDRRGGLVDIHATLWRHYKNEKIGLTIILLFKTLLNCWTTFSRPAYIWAALNVAEGSDRVVPFFTNRGGNLTLISHVGSSTADAYSTLDLCLHGQDWSIEGSSISGGLQCTQKRELMLLSLYTIVTLFEKVAVSCLGLSVAVSFLSFVVFSYDRILLRFPWMFLRALNVISTYSVLHLIHFANPVIAKRLPHEMITLCIALGWTNPCKREKLRTIVASLSAVLLILVGLALSICGLIVNVYMLSFVVLVVPSKWAKGDVLHLIAFVNRMANLVNLDHLEIDRLLLFRYGGSESKWKDGQEGQRQSQRAKGFFDLMARKVVNGKFVRSQTERLHGWMCLATFRSEDLQRLWLDTDHEKYRNDEEALKSSMKQADELLHSRYWPPRGSDPHHQRKDCEGPNLDDPEADHQLSYFLENMQSYRMWLESGKQGEVLLYDGSRDEQGAPNLISVGEQPKADDVSSYSSIASTSRTPAQIAVAPRIQQLEQMAERLMLNPSMEAFDQATVIHMEVEDLKQIGKRSQSLASAKHKQHDALATLGRATLTSVRSAASRLSTRLSISADHSQQPDTAGSATGGHAAGTELLAFREDA